MLLVQGKFAKKRLNVEVSPNRLKFCTCVLYDPTNGNKVLATPPENKGLANLSCQIIGSISSAIFNGISDTPV